MPRRRRPGRRPGGPRDARRRPLGRDGHRRGPGLAAAPVRLLLPLAPDPTRPGRRGWPRWSALLLEAGASPDTNDGGRRAYRSALKGSVEVNNPAITRLLLDAGASPDDGQCIGEAAGHRDHRCLELLLSAAPGWRARGPSAPPSTPTTQKRYRFWPRPCAARPGSRRQEATEALPDAAADASPEVVAALLAAGADPRASGLGDGLVRAAPGGAGRPGRDGGAAGPPRRAGRQHRRRPAHRRRAAGRPGGGRTAAGRAPWPSRPADRR